MAAQLPTQMLREYEYIRPNCLASNKSRKTLPVLSEVRVPSIHLRKGRNCLSILLARGQLKAHEKIAVFVDHKDGKKISIPHAKRKPWHAPMRIGVWPKILYRDAAGEFIVQVFKNMFLTRSCNHIIVP